MNDKIKELAIEVLQMEADSLLHLKFYTKIKRWDIVLALPGIHNVVNALAA